VPIGSLHLDSGDPARASRPFPEQPVAVALNQHHPIALPKGFREQRDERRAMRVVEATLIALPAGDAVLQVGLQEARSTCSGTPPNPLNARFVPVVRIR
jgi:hypothetical protein